MTTNKPPIAAWAPSTALHKLASRHNSAPCILTDGPAEFNDVALIRLSDYQRLQADHERLQAEYKRLQAAHEEELFCVRQNRDTHFGEMMRAIEQVEALQAECETLHKAIRRLCNIYVVDDYYSGDLREERLNRAITAAMREAKL